MDNLFEDINEKKDITDGSEALLQTNQTTDNEHGDGDTTCKDQTTGTGIVW